MGALEKAREAHEATPRTIEGDLVRKARGDRGCLGDGIAGGGAVFTVVVGLLASFGGLPIGLAFVGVGALVVGFVISAVGQSRSGKGRQLALEQGPLVGCHVLRHEEYLSETGRRAGRAVVLFTTDEDARFDAKYLRKTARRLEHALEREPGRHPCEALVKGNEDFGYHHLTEGVSDGRSAYVADVVVYPDLLDDGRLGPEQPAFAAIVDTQRAFIEHVGHD